MPMNAALAEVGSQIEELKRSTRANACDEEILAGFYSCNLTFYF
jgi:hypothetical protein